VANCLDQLQALQIHLVALKRQPADLDAVAGILAAVQVIRNASAERRQSHLVQVTTSGNDLLQMVLSRRVPTSPLVVEAIEIMVDAVRASLASLENEARDRAIARSQFAEPSPEVPPLGELLVSTGAVKRDDVLLALTAQDLGDGRKLGQILVALGKAAPQAVAAGLYQQRIDRGDSSGDTRPGGSTGPVEVNPRILQHLGSMMGELTRCHDELATYIAAGNDNATVQATLDRVRMLSRSLNQLVRELGT
jgi:hypothetical protein